MPNSSAPNRIVEANPRWNKPEVEVWHANDAGDLHELQFEVPVWARHDSIVNAFRAFGQKWIEYKVKQGYALRGRVRCHGPYPAQEFEKLDQNVFVISGRFVRTRPEVMSLDEAEPLFRSQPQNPGQSVASIYAQAMRVPGLIEGNARASADAKKRAPAARRAWDEADRERRERGLPAYEPSEEEQA